VHGGEERCEPQVPGIRQKDRSMCVRLDAEAPEGFLTTASRPARCSIKLSATNRRISVSGGPMGRAVGCQTRVTGALYIDGLISYAFPMQRFSFARREGRKKRT